MGCLLYVPMERLPCAGFQGAGIVAGWAFGVNGVAPGWVSDLRVQWRLEHEGTKGRERGLHRGCQAASLTYDCCHGREYSRGWWGKVRTTYGQVSDLPVPALRFDNG